MCVSVFSPLLNDYYLFFFVLFFLWNASSSFVIVLPFRKFFPLLTVQLYCATLYSVGDPARNRSKSGLAPRLPGQRSYIGKSRWEPKLATRLLVLLLLIWRKRRERERPGPFSFAKRVRPSTYQPLVAGSGVQTHTNAIISVRMRIRYPVRFNYGTTQVYIH